LTATSETIMQIDAFFDQRSTQERGQPLIVILHGTGGTAKKIAPLVAAAAEYCPDAAIWAPQMPHHGRLGIVAFSKVQDILNSLMEEIDRRMAEEGHTQLILIGHSFGAVLARKIVILAHGEIAEAPFDQGLSSWAEKRPWSRKISRLIMLGGMSRGWSSETARSWLLSIQWRVGSLLGEILSMLYARTPTIFSIRCGSPFIIGTRLQWLALLRAGRIGNSLVCTQILGTIDDFVAPTDSVDLAVDAVAQKAGRVHLIEMPATDHNSCIELGTPEQLQGAKNLADSVRGALARPSFGKKSQDAKDLRAKIFGA
jgi:pimeloyl-ACP methyl ester carboxylesterase